ncbi:hypothetical protein IC762_17640 [Bradyrhizobium genosp. L]|uniref:hypothetical protein n=1 Tax=Bradyrhizobium genosp. L TaxID=83637 RepID=UPI0018A2C777|nr:hypothetical protein [Bradyrhizobium genosp. L]QPF81649.1 hypothetical protein IC762_17640 [Bradyrhizobium genosp. L]
MKAGWFLMTATALVLAAFTAPSEWHDTIAAASAAFLWSVDQIICAIRESKK